MTQSYSLIRMVRRRRTLQTILWLLLILLSAYSVIPTTFYLSSLVRRTLIFGTFVVWPSHDYSKPEQYGPPHAKNFYIKSVGDTRLGTWYIPPKGFWKQLENCSSLAPGSWMFLDKRAVIIYYHGFGACRACDYRLELYKTLYQSERIYAHVFAVDYRGFGDSTKLLPDRKGLLHDATVTIYYVRRLLKDDESRILIWGHSLGTAIVMQLAEALTKLKQSPMGISVQLDR